MADEAPDQQENMDTAAATATSSSAAGDRQEQQQDASVDEDDRKVFVGGLPQDAKEAEISEHFSTFGEVEAVNLKTDPTTGRSRGFAFVVFKDAASVDKATEGGEEQYLKGKKVAVKKAQAKQGKVYVGRLQKDVTEEELREFFSGYGAVAAVEQPFDKVKNEKKNFCFITFEKEEPAKRLLKEGTVTIKEGHDVEIKKVTPKPDARGMGFGGGRGGGGMRGGGHPSWGGYGGAAGGGGWAGGYGDYGWGPYSGYGADPYYGGGWGGYGAGGGGWGYQGGAGYAGGKTPRGRGAPRGRGGPMGAGRGGQRQKPY